MLQFHQRGRGDLTGAQFCLMSYLENLLIVLEINRGLSFNNPTTKGSSRNFIITK